LKKRHRGLPQGQISHSNPVAMTPAPHASHLHRRAYSSARVLAVASCLFAAVAVTRSAIAQPTPPSSYVDVDLDLRFGTIVVFGSGTRTVTPSGGVTDSGLVPGTGDSPGPAQFSVGYQRGNNAKNPINVTLEIVVGTIPPVSQGGVTGSVTNLTSDLPGASTLTPGQIVTVSINGCRTVRCGVTFNLGGRLNVTRSWGGASLTTPVPVSVTVVSVN
jgi:hypothetical protein